MLILEVRLNKENSACNLKFNLDFFSLHLHHFTTQEYLQIVYSILYYFIYTDT